MGAESGFIANTGYPDLSSPAMSIAAVTPSDSVDLTIYARSLYIVGAGNVKVTSVGGVTETFAVPANFIMPVRVKRVFSTNTTATGIYALY